jgi:hypothetical protein
MKEAYHRAAKGVRANAERAATPAPCRECPFKRNSMRGYLGPWPNPEEIIRQAFSEAGFVCHMTITNQKNSNKYKVCTGSLVCANKSAKLFRDRNLQRLQAAAEDPGNVMGMREFCEYHKQETEDEQEENETNAG